MSALSHLWSRVVRLRSNATTIALYRRCQQYSSETTSEKTALYDFHVKHRGKMVNFAGYLLPVQYGDLSIVASHLHTRQNSSIFDVSHMLQTHIRGKDSIECFETLCTADVHGLEPNSGTLTVFTTNTGTIYDDLIVTKISSNHLYVVSNAAMRKQDMEIMENAIREFQSKGKDVSCEFDLITDRSLLAIQGPKTARILQKLLPKNLDINQLWFMKTIETIVAGVVGCRITRCGYTGEDGVEISIPSNRAIEIAETILDSGSDEIKLAGLGARDSLRLEAGLCLYGTDIDRTTTPIEAGLSWLVAKRRRVEANFPGAATINCQLKSGIEKRRIGFRMLTGPPARHDVEIFTEDRQKRIGRVTSGCPSPSLGGNIGIGYVNESFKNPERKIQLRIRDRFFDGTIARMPFVRTGYYVEKKKHV